MAGLEAAMMFSRYLARRKMRWAVQQIRLRWERRAEALRVAMLEARRLHHLSGRWGSDCD